MTTQEKFEIWDSTHPTLNEVEAYLERMKGDTPLQLVYRTSDGDIVKNHYIPHLHKKLLGILLPESNKLVRMATVDGTLFFAIHDKDDPSIVRNGMRKYMTKLAVNINYINAKSVRLPIRIINQNDMEKLSAYLSEFKKTLDVLKYNRIDIFDRVKLQHLAWSNSGLFCHDMKKNNIIPVYDYICQVGDMLVVSDYKPIEKSKID